MMHITTSTILKQLSF